MTDMVTPDSTSLVCQLVQAIRSAGPTVQPELLRAVEAARLCGVGTSSWHRAVSAGLAPRPVRLAGAVRWRRAELMEWIGVGCPDRRTWETRRGGAR